MAEKKSIEITSEMISAGVAVCEGRAHVLDWHALVEQVYTAMFFSRAYPSQKKQTGVPDASCEDSGDSESHRGLE